jgi:hypothetical protein
MKKLLFFAPALFLIASCTGPMGPSGPRGPQGPAGNANVFAFNYFVNPNNWIENGTLGTENYGFYAPFDLPELDEFLFEEGAVLVYMFDGAAQLPLPSIDNQNGFQTIYDFILFLEEIHFWVRETDNQTLRPNFQIEYKVILIDGFFKHLPDLQQMTLEEVERLFNISEYTEVKK